MAEISKRNSLQREANALQAAHVQGVQHKVSRALSLVDSAVLRVYSLQLKADDLDQAVSDIEPRVDSLREQYALLLEDHALEKVTTAVSDSADHE